MLLDLAAFDVSIFSEFCRSEHNRIRESSLMSRIPSKLLTRILSYAFDVHNGGKNNALVRNHVSCSSNKFKLKIAGVSIKRHHIQL